MKYVRITNKEILSDIKTLLESVIDDIFDDRSNEHIIRNFIFGIFEKNINKINQNLQEYLLTFSSYHLFNQSKRYERVYQVLLMFMFIFLKSEGLTAEELSGYGRYDFGFPNKYVREEEYILIEVKVFNKDNEKKKKILNKKEIRKYLHKECKDAINQIETKKYETKHKSKGYSKIIKYGIAFYEKYGKVEMKITDEKKINFEVINNNNSNNNINNNKINNNKINNIIH